MKVPLSLRICQLLLLNVVLVLIILWWVVVRYYGLGWSDVTEGSTANRVTEMAQLVATSLEPLDREEWEPVLSEYEEAYKVNLALYRPHGERLIEGTEWEVSKIEETLFQGPGHNSRGRPPRPPGRRDDFDGPPRRERRQERRQPRPDEGQRDPEFLDIVKTDSGHVAGIRLRLREGPRDRRRSMILLVREQEGSSLFFSWKPFFWAVVGVFILTALVWVPWIYRVTRRLGILTRGAESISKGDFEVQVATARTDEIGQLSRSLQMMAGKLDDYVSGQKRFLGDIAHELCSPLVRIRMGLGVLEHKLEQEDFEKLETVQAEVEELSQLVNELLDFSKASLKPKSLPVSSFDLSQLCRDVVMREGAEEDVTLQLKEGLTLETNQELLRRALGNVVRNAVRYAKEIELSAVERGDMIELEVKDRGPGIEPEWIEKIFEPFTRPDGARTRESGGAGLGMAIAKTCIESLKGKISCKNRDGGGLSVILQVPKVRNLSGCMEKNAG